MLSAIASKPAGPAARAGAWVALACLALMFAVPFLWPVHTKPFTTFYSEWLAALLLMAACSVFCMPSPSSRQSGIVLPAAAPLFVPLIAVILLQWMLGRFVHESDAVFPLMTLVLATAAVILGAAIARTAGLARLLTWLCVATLVGGLLSVAIQFMQVASTYGVRFPLLNFQTGGQYYGALAQRNHLSTYLNWSLIAALYLYAGRRIAVPTLCVVVLVLFAGVSLTASRTGLLQIVWIAIAAFVLMRMLPPEQRPRHWKWVLALPLLFASVNLGLPYLLGEAALTVTGTPVARAASEGLDSARRQLYANGFSLFLSHPLLGIGPGQLFHNQFVLLDQIEKTLYASSTHNVVLDLFVFTGMVGALPFLWLLGAWLLRVLKQTMDLERGTALLFISTLAVHAMLELPHWYGFFLLPAALLCGALDPGSLRFQGGRLLRLLPMVLCVYGAIVAGSLFVQYRNVEHMYARYSQDRNPSGTEEQRLVELLSFQQKTWFTAPVEYLVFTNIALNDNALRDKIAIGERTIRHQPEPHVVYRYVLLLALDGRQQEGIALLERTRKMFPEAYEDIATEFRKLAVQQPEVFGRLVTSLPAEEGKQPVTSIASKG